MESFLVGLLFASILIVIWAVCIAAFGAIAIIPLFFGTLCGAIIADNA